MITESNNTIIKHLVNRLRDIRTHSFEFRTTIEEISRILLSEALANHDTITVNIDTWQGDLDVQVVEEQSLVFIPILRAGEPMLTGILKSLPNARSGFLAMKRDEATASSHLFYESLPNLAGKTVILLDPMVATGGSLNDAVALVKEKKPKRIISLNILGSQLGVKVVAEAHGDIDMFIAQIDPRLDDNKYIRPGLGDAGDRAFHTQD
ncbi:MAG: uracil phosphoribosyltransferase [Gammaproteobacteria bacterium]|nr:MAG: uracil phosphoribosyltransferase [Gammaproteobacteria bacterium]